MKIAYVNLWYENTLLFSCSWVSLWVMNVSLEKKALPKKLFCDMINPWIKGGAEKRIYVISKRLVKRGHDVHLFGMKRGKGL